MGVLTTLHVTLHGPDLASVGHLIRALVPQNRPPFFAHDVQDICQYAISPVLSIPFGVSSLTRLHGKHSGAPLFQLTLFAVNLFDMNGEPHMAACEAIDDAKFNVTELARQREEFKERWRQAVNECHQWEAKCKTAIMERDHARMERDVARAELHAGHGSP